MNNLIEVDPICFKSYRPIRPNIFKISPGDVITIDIRGAMQSFDFIFDKNKFFIRKIYAKRIVPTYWCDKLKFWEWIRKKVCFELEFRGV